MTLTKAEIAGHLSDTLGLGKRDAKTTVDLFFDTVKGRLEQAETVKLSGFGVFGLRDKAARPGRNPKTGEAATITARRVVTFRPGTKQRAKIDKALAAKNQ